MTAEKHMQVDSPADIILAEIFCRCCCHRMDDIQLCKDIMSLKQELRKIVTVPGKLTSTPSTPPPHPHEKNTNRDGSKAAALSEVFRCNHSPSQRQTDSFKCTRMSAGRKRQLSLFL